MVATKMTKRQRRIVAGFPPSGTFTTAQVPSSVMVITMSPREIIAALDACVVETAGQSHRLEKTKSGPVPEYKWVHESIAKNDNDR